MNNKVLETFTMALFDRGLDYEVTLKGSEVRVRVFDSSTESTIGIDTSTSLESALASVLAGAAKGAVMPKLNLSDL